MARAGFEPGLTDPKSDAFTTWPPRRDDHEALVLPFCPIPDFLSIGSHMGLTSALGLLNVLVSVHQRPLQRHGDVISRTAAGSSAYM